MIKVDNMSMYYQEDKYVLDNINLKIDDGKYILICGNSGIGKSTFLEIVAGLKKPVVGNVFYDDICLYKMSNKEISDFRKENIGFLSQETNLINSLNILDNVCLPRIMNGKEKDIKKVYELGMHLLEYVGLHNIAKKWPKQLSGGQKRRAEIARALINEPDYIIMDEPTSSLDDECVTALCSIFDNLHSEGRTLLISTHDTRLKKQNPDNIFYIENREIRVNDVEA